MRLYTGTISPTLLDRRLTGCHIEMPKTSALWRHHFIMDSQDEGEALCDTLNANCQQIATAQKVRSTAELCFCLAVTEPLKRRGATFPGG